MATSRVVTSSNNREHFIYFLYIVYGYIEKSASFMAQEEKRLLIDTLISSVYSRNEVAKIAGVSLATFYNVIVLKKSASSLSHKRVLDDLGD